MIDYLNNYHGVICFMFGGLLGVGSGFVVAVILFDARERQNRAEDEWNALKSRLDSSRRLRVVRGPENDSL